MLPSTYNVYWNNCSQLQILQELLLFCSVVRVLYLCFCSIEHRLQAHIPVVGPVLEDCLPSSQVRRLVKVNDGRQRAHTTAPSFLQSAPVAAMPPGQLHDGGRSQILFLFMRNGLRHEVQTVLPSWRQALPRAATPPGHLQTGVLTQVGWLPLPSV